jgi:hypothetical protein
LAFSEGRHVKPLGKRLIFSKYLFSQTVDLLLGSKQAVLKDTRTADLFLPSKKYAELQLGQRGISLDHKVTKQCQVACGLQDSTARDSVLLVVYVRKHGHTWDSAGAPFTISSRGTEVVKMWGWPWRHVAECWAEAGVGRKEGLLPLSPHTPEEGGGVLC